MNSSCEFSGEQPMNHLALPTNNLSDSSYSTNASSLAINRGLSNRYYTLANLSPNSSFYFSGDDVLGQPHNRQNPSLPAHQKSFRQTRNNYRNRNQFQQSFLQNSSDLNSSAVLELNYQSPTRADSDLNAESTENNSLLPVSTSYDGFQSYPLRTLRNFHNDITDDNEYHGNINTNNYNSGSTRTEGQNAKIFDRSGLTIEADSFVTQAANVDDLPYNWQATKSTIKDRISIMFNNQALADVYFLVGRSPHIRRIPAHQFILAISSVVFDAMFFGPLSAKQLKKETIYIAFEEGNNNNEKNSSHPNELDVSILEISVPDVEPVAFLAMLKFIYTDEVHLGPDTVMTTLYAAKKYSISALEKACVDYLKRNLCSENAFMLLTQARLFNEVQLAHQCLDVIDKNTSDSLAADGFLDVDLETLCSVLDRDTLGIREIKLFQATVRWADAQIRKLEYGQSTVDNPENGDDTTPSDIQQMIDKHSVVSTESQNNESSSIFSFNVSSDKVREVLGPALQLIRFPLMTIDDFANNVAQTRILQDREMVDMFLFYLTNPKPVVPYKNTPRCCLTGKEQVVNRYPVVEQRWGYSGTSDRIRFTVDRKIFVVGFGLYGSAQGPSEYHAVIEILQQDTSVVLASNYLTFKCDGSNSTFRVRFKEPVEILPNVSYVACATLKGPDSYYGSIGYQKVIHESATHGKVSFQFYYAAGNNNGTSVEDGQIPEIIFYM